MSNKINIPSLCKDVIMDAIKDSQSLDRPIQVAIIAVGDAIQEKAQKLFSIFQDSNITVSVTPLPNDASYRSILAPIQAFGCDPVITGIYLMYDPSLGQAADIARLADQLPVYRNIGAVGPFWQGKLLFGTNEVIPPDTAAIFHILSGLDLGASLCKTRNVIIMDWYGKFTHTLTPLLLQAGYTVMNCTRNTDHECLIHQISYADIVISCIGDSAVLENSNDTCGVLSSGKVLIDASCLLSCAGPDIPQSWNDNSILYVTDKDHLDDLSNAFLLYNAVRLALRMEHKI